MNLAWNPHIKPQLTGEALRMAFSKFATGVTVLTTNTQDGPVGITVNSFSSVSLDPPLVLFSLGKDVSRLPAFSETS
ncbi:MAG: flavin reductase family protein, partial [Pseudomonadota bacterium]